MKRVAVITSSDKGYRGEREDLSGPAVKEIMEAAGMRLFLWMFCRMTVGCLGAGWLRSQIWGLRS